MLQNFIIPTLQYKTQVRVCFVKPILSVRAAEKDTCCLSVVYALMVDCQLKVRMARPGPFYNGTSYLSVVSSSERPENCLASVYTYH